MKIESKQIESAIRLDKIGRLLAEPFLFVGLGLFWSIVLPVTAIFFGLLAAVEPIVLHLTGLRTAFRHTPRMSQRPA
jgi:uncharacterized membrane protein